MDLTGVSLTVCMRHNSLLLRMGRDFSYSVGLENSSLIEKLFNILGMFCSLFDIEREDK